MASTFDKRLRALSEQIGEGVLEGVHYRPQPYSAAQEVRTYYNHPRGGQAYYTVTALQTTYRPWFARLARNLLRGDLAEAMAENMNDFDDDASKLAPIETGLLRRSGGAMVNDNGVRVYDRPPEGPYNILKTRGVPG